MERATREDVDALVARVLAEDLGNGDVTAALVAADARLSAGIITREAMVLAGRDYAQAVFHALDPAIAVDWQHDDGDAIAAGEPLCDVEGPARPILTGERAALNLLQTLSATATVTAQFVEAVAGTGCRILDTRKTLPGLRLAQKHAVRCGGGTNHRMGLYDAVLIKENHIHAAGDLTAAVAASRERHPALPIETEVESLAELETALAAGVDRVLLDNFSLDDLGKAVSLNAGHAERAKLEASGNVDLSSVRDIAKTGVDFISIGALTKHVRAIDLSMRFSV